MKPVHYRCADECALRVPRSRVHKSLSASSCRDAAAQHQGQDDPGLWRPHVPPILLQQTQNLLQTGTTHLMQLLVGLTRLQSTVFMLCQGSPWLPQMRTSKLLGFAGTVSPGLICGSGIAMKGLLPFCLNCVKRENASSFLPRCANEVRETGLLFPECTGGSF